MPHGNLFPCGMQSFVVAMVSFGVRVLFGESALINPERKYLQAGRFVKIRKKYCAFYGVVSSSWIRCAWGKLRLHALKSAYARFFKTISKWK